MAEPEHGHDPVLLAEVLELLDPQPGEVAVDCTLGRGGHALAIADRLGPTGTLIGLDADPRNLAYAEQRLADSPCTVELHHANFGTLPNVLGDRAVDVLLADFGVSTNQLTSDTHGLSFTVDAPLDMRLDP
ncbi:MAG: 16S rRNA (cytosine(1402)-N(4))-methyltransferase, partial [Planctomycetota bacterium]